MKPSISSEEKRAVIRFIVLFIVLGMPAGFHSAITLLLQGSGISSGQLGLYKNLL